MPNFLCIGARIINIWIVEQFGFAIILSVSSMISPFISGIINFFEGSILHAEELSITTVPLLANFGAHSEEVLPPAEKIAMSGLSSTAFSKSIIE